MLILINILSSAYSQQRNNLRQNGDKYENTGIPNNCDDRIYGVTIKGKLFEINKIDTKDKIIKNLGNVFPFKCNAIAKGFNNKIYAVKADEEAKTNVYEFNTKSGNGSFSKWSLPAHSDGGWISGAIDSKGKLYFMTTTLENLVRIDIRKAKVDIIWKDDLKIKDWNKSNCEKGCNFYINQKDEIVVKENKGNKIWYVSLGENPRLIKSENLDPKIEINPTNDFIEFYCEKGNILTLLLRKNGISNYSLKTKEVVNLVKIDTLENGILTDLAGCNYFNRNEEKVEEEEKDELININTNMDETIRLKNVIFKLGESDLLPESYLELDKLVKQLRKYKNVEILLEGHTDITGDYNENIKLSLDRVNSCKKYLMNKGIESRRIQTKGFGSTRPLSRSKNEKEREINRRVEFKLTKGIE